VESREVVVQLGKLYLELGFPGYRLLGEDAQDYLLTVDYRPLSQAFPVSLLRWGKNPVEEQNLRLPFFCAVGDAMSRVRRVEKPGVGRA
jgi:hypothetical protein